MGVKIVNRIEVDASNMRIALEAAVSEKKTTIPVLTHVLLEPSKKSIRVVSTDLELWALTDIDGKSTSKVPILIPFRKAFDLLKGENGPAVFSYQEIIETVKDRKPGQYVNGEWIEGEEFEREDRAYSVTLDVGSVSYELSALGKENFPVTPEVHAPQFSLLGLDFKAMLSRLTFAISKENSRYTLNGMLLKGGNNQLILAATDGHRLATQLVELDGIPEVQTLVPSAALDWLSKHLGKTSAGIYAGEEHVIFSLPNIRTVLIARKISGQFPNYEAVMPKKDAVNHVAVFPSAADLAKVLAKVSQMADGRSHAVKWKLNGSCELSASSSESGKAFARVNASITSNVDSEVPAEVFIGLCTLYVLDFLKVAGKNPVTLELRDAQSAALLEVPSIPGYSHVVMPMRI